MSVIRVLVFAFVLVFSVPSQASYQCQGEDDCQQRWWRVLSWLEDNAKFKVRQKGNDRVEAKSKTPAYKTRLEYVVEKRALPNDSWEIIAQASCRVSTGCPNPDTKLKQLYDFLAQPLTEEREADTEQAGASKAFGIEPIKLHVDDEGCDEASSVHHLRTSWAGKLYEVDCLSKGNQQKRESLVVRCRAGQCRSLR